VRLGCSRSSHLAGVSQVMTALLSGCCPSGAVGCGGCGGEAGVGAVRLTRQQSGDMRGQKNPANYLHFTIPKHQFHNKLSALSHLNKTQMPSHVIKPKNKMPARGQRSGGLRLFNCQRRSQPTREIAALTNDAWSQAANSRRQLEANLSEFFSKLGATE